MITKPTENFSELLDNLEPKLVPGKLISLIKTHSWPLCPEDMTEMAVILESKRSYFGNDHGFHYIKLKCLQSNGIIRHVYLTKIWFKSNSIDLCCA